MLCTTRSTSYATYGLGIKDPNLVVVIEFQDIKSTRIELSSLAEGAATTEQLTHLAIVDIYRLADKDDGYICDKDREVRSLMRVMCVILTHPLKPL